MRTRMILAELAHPPLWGKNEADEQESDDDPMPELPFGDEIFHLMRRVMQEHGMLWQRTLPELTKAQYAALRVIGAHPGIEQIAVTAAAAITPATLAEMLGRLVQRGLVSRETDPGDARRRLLTLTESGAALLSTVKPKAEGLDAIFFERLEPEQTTQLSSLLQLMTTRPSQG